jgi:hypothetical protein
MLIEQVRLELTKIIGSHTGDVHREVRVIPSLTPVHFKSLDFGHEAFDIALLMAVKALTAEIPPCPFGERFAWWCIALRRKGIGMVVGKYQPLQPCGGGSDIIVLSYEVGNFLDLCVEGIPHLVIYQCDTVLVPLSLRTPVVGIDLKFAGALDIKSLITDTKVDGCTTG